MASYLYNNVLLPGLPSEVLADYGNCLIRKNTSTGNYEAFFCDLEYYMSDENTVYGRARSKPKYTVPIDGADTAEEWTVTTSTILNIDIETDTISMVWANNDIYTDSTLTEVFYAGSEPVLPGGRKFLIRSGSTLYTVADGALTVLSSADVTAQLFQDSGVDTVPGAILGGLTDPEVLYWQEDAEAELPELTMTVKGVPAVPQTVTSGPQDLTHESIAGIDYAFVTASEDVLFAVSFDDGGTWLAHNGSAWYTVTDTVRGMTAATFTAITAEQWAEVAVLQSCRIRYWLPNATAYVTTAGLRYVNP